MLCQQVTASLYLGDAAAASSEYLKAASFTHVVVRRYSDEGHPPAAGGSSCSNCKVSTYEDLKSERERDINNYVSMLIDKSSPLRFCVSMVAYAALCRRHRAVFRSNDLVND